MRRILSISLIASVLIVPIDGAKASHAPKQDCSESGDICQEVAKTSGDFKFRLSMAAKYFDRYKICVTAPDEGVDCKGFNVKQMNGGVYGGKVSWVDNFPPAGTGDYTVIWKQDGNKFGKRLGFHVKEE